MWFLKEFFIIFFYEPNFIKLNSKKINKKKQKGVYENLNFKKKKK